jgi:hypothetical protein
MNLYNLFNSNLLLNRRFVFKGGELSGDPLQSDFSLESESTKRIAGGFSTTNPYDSLVSLEEDKENFDKEKIYIRGGGNHETKKGWIEGGAKIRLVTTLFQPFLYVQVFHGYGEAMINYDKTDTAVRVGLIFE